MGMILAGIASSKNAVVLGQVAIEQGYAPDDGEHIRPDLPDEESVTHTAAPTLTNEDGAITPEEPSSEAQSDPPDGRRSIQGAQTTPILPLHVSNIRKPKLAVDPFGQLEDTTIASSHYQSTPAISSIQSPRLSRASTLTQTDILLQKYDTEAQSQLLRKQFCRSEVRHSIN